ncbi:MAG: SusD/RagB family nutrient-binding outer membrane lipoprotein [Pseudobacter sp.]|uniref:SusD/RagB family nutrient-binding outer membrane lipoprotein n=1 Tax=Pseudobacter sp. TaxID=2045420 RepID=UPI003F7D8B5B
MAENPAQFPVFNSNAEAAVLKWNGTIVTTDPFTNPTVTSLRELDFNIPSICNFFILKLNSWNDPRIDISNTYGTGSRNRMGIAPGPGGFIGIESGYTPGGGGETKQSYFYSYSNSDFSIQKSPLAGGVIMSYAELQFILAEAAAKNWITTGSAEEYYYKGIAASINYWVPAFPEDITNPVFTSYIAATTGIEWDNNLILDKLTGDSQMERIHLMKYYSLFLNDFQQWFEYRRTGHPILPKGAGLKNGGIMPARMNYPIYVQATNPTNYSKAVQSMGGDAVNTLMWWQKP